MLYNEYKSKSVHHDNEDFINNPNDEITLQTQNDVLLSPKFSNKIFDEIDFFQVDSLNFLITTISYSIESNSKNPLFSDDFNFFQFLDYIFNTLLSFDGEKVFFSSKLLLTLSYVADETLSYLSNKMSEMIAIFTNFYQNRYILILFQNIFIKSPSSVGDAINLGLLNILDTIKKSTTQIKDLEIIASIIHFVALNLNDLNQEQSDLCFNFAHDFLLINNRKIFYSALSIVLHFQEKFEFLPNVIFNEESCFILLNQLSQHHNILPIIGVLSHFHDIQFINFLISNNFQSIIQDIVQKENETINITVLTYLLNQIKANNELGVQFSFIVCILGNSIDIIRYHLKIAFFKFFIVCLKTNFDFVYNQDFFEYIFCLIFDLLEEIPQSDLGEIIFILNCLINDKKQIFDFIVSHNDCYQAVYNLCMHEDILIEKNAQNIISIIKERD